jgi:hypothetical protein
MITAYKISLSRCTFPSLYLFSFYPAPFPFYLFAHWRLEGMVITVLSAIYFLFLYSFFAATVMFGVDAFRFERDGMMMQDMNGRQTAAIWQYDLRDMVAHGKRDKMVSFLVLICFHRRRSMYAR